MESAPSGEGGTGLILASASRYRRDLLERFGLAFKVHAAEIDETPLEDESPRTLVQRLSVAKARAVARAVAARGHRGLGSGRDVRWSNRRQTRLPRSGRSAAHGLRRASGRLPDGPCRAERRRGPTLDPRGRDDDPIPPRDGRGSPSLRRSRPAVGLRWRHPPGGARAPVCSTASTPRIRPRPSACPSLSLRRCCAPRESIL